MEMLGEGRKKACLSKFKMPAMIDQFTISPMCKGKEKWRFVKKLVLDGLDVCTGLVCNEACKE